MHRVLIMILIGTLGGPALAAPALTGTTCLIRGEVLKVAERQVTREKGWARNWGVPETVSYTDVTILPVEVSHLEDGFSPSCTGEEQVFQIDGNPPEVGSCIRGSAVFFGDEFRIGTWLTGIEETSCD